ncbi:MAG TPA: trypsin-like serine protease [Labilithrix sp.]|nr:trypsin-like serine protease [Labilithrix sp.]
MQSIVRNGFAATTLLAAATACALDATDEPPRDQAQLLSAGAAIEKYPFTASISYSQTKEGHRSLDNVVCGGIIVSESYVLTAAHCVEPSPNDAYLKANHLSEGSPYLVQAGSRTARRNLAGSAADIQQRYVDAIITHPEYSTFSFVPFRGTRNADLALLHLRTPLVFTHRVQKANIGSARDGDASDRIFAVGWGTHRRRKDNDHLGEHRVRLLDPAGLTDDQFNWARFTDTLPFLSNCSDKRDAIYYGDSGGPLVRRSAGSQTTVIGMLSHFATPGQPLFVAEDLSLYKGWIEEHIRRPPPSAETHVVEVKDFQLFTNGCWGATCFQSERIEIPKGARLMSTYFELETPTHKSAAVAYAFHDDYLSSTIDATSRHTAGETALRSLPSLNERNLKGFSFYGEGTVSTPRAGGWKIAVVCSNDCDDIDFEKSRIEISYDTDAVFVEGSAAAMDGR